MTAAPMPEASSSASSEAHAEVLEEVRDPGADLGPDARLLEPVERDRADHHGEHGDGSRQRRQVSEAGQRPAQHDLAPLPLEDRHPGEEVEVGRERLAPVDPRLDAVDAHAEEGDAGVDERRGGEGTRLGAVR